MLSRAREKGLDGAQLRELGEREGLPELVAAGLFLDQYLTNLDHQGATDYADLIRRATIEAETHREELRARFRHVFVDEYQDTDPGQVALLRAIAGDGRDLTVVGDPHQSIYGFRGAEVRGILDFPTEFPRADGQPADVVALRTTRRFGPRMLVASQRVARRLGLPGSIPEEARAAFLEPVAEAGDPGRGPGLGPHLRHRAGRGRAPRRPAPTGPPRGRHAVGRHGGPGPFRPYVDPAAAPRPRRRGRAGRGRQRRAAAGPRPRGPAAARRAAGGRQPRQRRRRPRRPHRRRPGGGAAARPARRSRRRRSPAARPALRTREKDRRQAEERPPRPSRELVRRAVVDDGFLAGLDGPEVGRARALTDLLPDAREASSPRAATSRGGAVDPLVAAPAGRGGCAGRSSSAAGPRAAPTATSTAVCALFDVAARAEERRDHVGVRAFLATLVAQQIPADTLAERGARGAAVRLLTAHRAKGLEWRLVVVAHVQQEGWPDLRRRSTLLQADRIGAGEVVPPVTPRELLVEERRLFYVACTRARQRLVVTAVQSPEDDGEQPSRFLEELGVSVDHVVGRPPRPLSMAGLVSELRRTLADPATSEPLRDAAARRLARLAAESVGTRPLVPTADPSTWWGTRAATRSVQPVRDPDQPLPVSASMLESLGVCPTQWFLEREAGGVARAHQSANLGELRPRPRPAGRDRRARGRPRRRRPADDPRRRRSGTASTSGPRGRSGASTSGSGPASGRFLQWHHANPRRLLDTEAKFTAVVELTDGEQVCLTGYADRLELDADGRVVVVDLKSGPSRAHPEVRGGARPARALPVRRRQRRRRRPHRRRPPWPAAPSCVQLGLEDGRPEAVVQPQAVQADDGPGRTDLRARLARPAALRACRVLPCRGRRALPRVQLRLRSARSRARGR